MKIRGVHIDHATIQCWVYKFTSRIIGLSSGGYKKDYALKALNLPDER